MTRFENDRPVPQDLADGKVLAPGETVDLSAEQAKEPHNKRLIDEGALVKPSAKKQSDDPEKEADA